jgi:hypothetical protein
MEYSKPKITIDLEEYNALLKAKSEKYDPDEVATLAATIAISLVNDAKQLYGQDSRRLIDDICREVDYTIDIKLAANHTSQYPHAIAKVIKKPIR